MEYKIHVTTANNNIVGIGPLADENTFKFYADMLGVYKNSPWLHDNLIYFIPELDNYKDGCFKVSDVIDVITLEDAISVKVRRFYLIPKDRTYVLDEFEFVSEYPQKISTIDLKTGDKI